MNRSILLILSILTFLSFIACAHKPEAKVAGVEPIPEVYLFENHSDSFPVWKEHHAAGRVLVHFDGHVDFDWIPEIYIKKIISCRTADELRKRIVHLYEMKAGYEGKISIWNFIYPAARSGIVREFFWVVPDGTFGRKNVLEDFRSFLAIKMHGITPAELEMMQLSGNRISGKLLGIPITVVTLSSLPSIEEPVLLDIDVDYFTTNSALDQKVLFDPSMHPADFLKKLTEKKLRTDLVTISYSSVGGFLPLQYHYFGDMIKERLQDPRSAKNEEDFKREGKDDPVYKDADLHEADALRAAGQMNEAIDLYRKYSAEHQTSPYLRYAKRRLATALADSKQTEAALNELKIFVSEHPDEPDARYYIGRLYKESGDLKDAVAEFRKAVGLDTFNGVYATELGSCLLGLGDNAEALKWLQKGIELKPCNGNARLNFAYYYFNNREMDKAAEEFKSALFVRPWDANAHFMLGRIYYEQKRYMDALEEWKKTIQIAPDHKAAREGLAALGFR